MAARRATQALAAAGEQPSALHNNCSGKHAGFICMAADRGLAPAGYIAPDHPVMLDATAALANVTGARLDERNRAIDGCAIPTYAIALQSLARGFARFGSGDGLPPPRAAAAARLRAAVAANPFMVAGEGRFDTVIMTLLGARVFCKGGAEGVLAACLPDFGLGIAVKCRDGAQRAAEVTMAALIARHLPMTADEESGLQALLNPRITNWNGTVVGEIRARV